MSNVLIVLSPVTDASGPVAYALQRAKEARGGLIALVTLPHDVAQHIATTLSDEAFVGGKVSDDVVAALGREQRAQAEDLLRDIRTQAEQAGVPFTPLIETGEPREVCGPIVAAHNVGLAILVAEKRSWFARLLSRSTRAKLPSLFGCDVKVIDQ